jgi:hypothetical protein
MTDLAKHNPQFNIEVSLGGQQPETIIVQPQETSDGVEYFLCLRGEEQLTQIRKEGKDKWEQMWGELSESDVDTLGQEITKQNQDGNS